MNFINFFKKNQLFWNIIRKISFIYPKSRFKTIPKDIIIEPTNICNLKCPVCMTHLAMKREKGMMSFDLFKSIIDDFNGYLQKPKILLVTSGEPLLNKDIAKFVGYAHKNGHKTVISTNATMLTESLSRELLENGLTQIWLCIDGFSKKSHEAYRIGSDFNEVKKNIEIFLSIKNSKNFKTIATIQTLLTSFSENEMEDILKWATEHKADSVLFKTMSIGSYTSKKIKETYKYLLPKKSKHLRKRNNVFKTLCRTPEKQAIVFWNGDLGLCCVDCCNKDIKFPNIKEKGFIKTFFQDDVVKKRINGFMKKYPICQKCNLSNADTVSYTYQIKK